MAADVPPFGGSGRAQSPAVLRNGLFNLAGQTVRGAVGLLTIPFLIRFLGIREYGVWSLAYAVLALMSVAEAGLSVATTVFLSKDLARSDQQEAGRTLTFAASAALLLAAFMGLFLWIAGPRIVEPLAAFGSSDRAEVGRALQIAGVGVAVLIVQKTLVGIEQAFDRYGTINLLDFSQSILANLGLLAVAWLGGRTVELMEWQVLASAILLAAHGCVVFRILWGRSLRLQWSAKKARQIIPYSVATWFATLGCAAFAQCDRLLVGGVLGAPLLGVYAAITDVTSRINSFSGTAVQPLVPALSRDAARPDPSDDRIRQAAHLNALIAIEAGIFLYVLADKVMGIMAPAAATSDAILGLQIAAIIYTLYSVNAPGYFLLYSLGEARTNASVVLCSGIVTLGLILFGAVHFGLLGAIAGNVGYLGTLLLNVVGLKRAGIALRRYLAWMTVPSLWFMVALVAGALLERHLGWRALFVAAQMVLFVLWFVNDHGRAWRMQLGLSAKG